MRRRQGGYLLEVPIIVMVVAAGLAVVMPQLPPFGQKIAVILGALEPYPLRDRGGASRLRRSRFRAALKTSSELRVELLARCSASYQPVRMREDSTGSSRRAAHGILAAEQLIRFS